MTDWLDPRTFPDDDSVTLWVDPDNEIYCHLDRVDYEWAIRWKWSFTRSKEGKKVYITRLTRVGGRQVKLYLHKEVLKRKTPEQPSSVHFISDHMDGDSRNNRRGNLRWATPTMNAQNRFGAAARQAEMFGAAA
jgi:hypothetical protein